MIKRIHWLPFDDFWKRLLLVYANDLNGTENGNKWNGSCRRSIVPRLAVSYNLIDQLENM